MRLLLLLAVLGQWSVGQTGTGTLTVCDFCNAHPEADYCSPWPKHCGPGECPKGKAIVYVDHRFKCMEVTGILPLGTPSDTDTGQGFFHLPSKGTSGITKLNGATATANWTSASDLTKHDLLISGKEISVVAPDESYNFILPKKIPGNGLYTCKIQAHVLEIVGERKKSQDAAIGLIGAALGVIVGWILGILFPPPKKKLWTKPSEVAQ